MSLAEFFRMGGHGGFIWPAWGIGFAVIAGITLTAIRRHGKLRRALAELGDGKERRQTE